MERASSDPGPSEYRFVHANAAFQEVTGLSDVAGKPCGELLPSFDAHAVELFDGVLRTGEPVRFVADDDGAGLMRRVDAYAFRVGAAERRRVAVQLVDVTERMRKDDELRHRLDEVAAIVDHAPLGVFLVDASFRLLHVNAFARAGSNEEVDELLGRDFEEILNRNGPSDLIDKVVGSFRHTLATGESFREEELLSTRLDGAMTHTDWRIDRIRLPNGSDAVVCYFRDVTAQVEARQSLAASETRYRSLFEHMDEGFAITQVVYDEGGTPVASRVIETNPAFERQTGLRGAAGRLVRDVNPDVEPFWLDTLAEIARSGEAKRFTNYSPSLGRWFETFAFPTGEPGEHNVASLVSDVTARVQADAILRENLATLHHHAHHDELTGLPNRVLFEDRLQRALVEAERHGRLLAVLFLDLDGFKRVNDDLGHACGDAALEEVARRLGAMLRESDTLARLHGDEFVVLLPEIAAADDAHTLAQTLRTAVAPAIALDGHEVTLTASVGVGVFPRDARDPTGLLRAADAAMYLAKRDAKNGVRGVGP